LKSLSSNGFPVRVGSLEQLDDSIRQPLFLAGVRFSQNISGQNLYELISNIFVVAASIAAWWKNNSVTKEAIKADKTLKELKNLK
jgi:SPP1 family holin